MGAALEGTGRPFLVTAGMGAATEDDEGDASNARHPSEKATLGLASRGVRAVLVRLPPSVHGDGDHGLVPMLIAVARAKGVSAFIGEGLNRWPAVHRLDTAQLYRLVLEKGAAGARYHAVGDEAVATKDLAGVIGRRLKLPVVSVAKAEAVAHFGFLGHFFGRDVPASSAKTRQLLGWQPTHTGLLEDLESGSYFG